MLEEFWVLCFFFFFENCKFVFDMIININCLKIVNVEKLSLVCYGVNLFRSDI